jgi:hypothetical protein
MGDAVISISDDGIRRRPARPSSSCPSGGGGVPESVIVEIK